MTNIDFYEEVKISKSAKNNNYHGMNGVVFGISEEDGVVYSYSVYIPEMRVCVSFNRDELETTGNKFSRDDFY